MTGISIIPVAKKNILFYEILSLVVTWRMCVLLLERNEGIATLQPPHWKSIQKTV